MAAVILGLWLFRSTLIIGFLLDDFYHLDYLIRAFNGHPDALTHLLWSNWSPDTTLTSYRPLVSFSLAADYAIWHINAWGYHLTNVFLFGACVVFVGLIARELCIAFDASNEDAVGIGASLLFAAYPLHTEAVAWIIGRVDVLCGLLTFAATYCYFVHARTSRRPVLVGAVVMFVLAMMCKEMAVTLPVALTVFELLRAKKLDVPRRLLWMWGALIGFALWRTIILGTVIGGYGGTGWRTVKQGWKNFRDVPTLKKLIFGLNEEMTVPPWSAAVVAAIAASSLLGVRASKWKLYVFLLAWAFITVIPTFQIWHIWPNLVGSRLAFLSSGPLCMLLAVLYLSAWRIGGIGCGALVLCWAALLQVNLKPWTIAGQYLGAFKARLELQYPRLSEQHKIFIPILPQDFKGAPILGRPEYLTVLCKPPFADKDYSDYILTAEPIIAGGEEYVGPQQYLTASHIAKETIILDVNDHLLGRLTDETLHAPRVSVAPQNPLTLKERFDWLHHHRNIPTVLEYDCSTVPDAVSARVYIGKPWQPFSNAPRAVPPDPQFVEREIGPLPTRSSAIMPQTTPGVHDVAVMAFDKDSQPVGILSETVSIISPQAEQKTAH